MPYYAKRTDANDHAIEQAARAMGIDVIDMTKWGGGRVVLNGESRNIGHDKFFIIDGVLFPVEIKNPATRWKLTDNEVNAREFYSRHGIEFVVITNVDDLTDFIGRHRK